MIPNQWYVILESSQIKKGKILGVTRMGEKMVAWRNNQGELSVMSDKCPHRGVALSVARSWANASSAPSMASNTILPELARLFRP